LRIPAWIKRLSKGVIVGVLGRCIGDAADYVLTEHGGWAEIQDREIDQNGEHLLLPRVRKILVAFG
jgi:hypothetical protein